ncbi:hypothetical protein PCASD_15556 [Puccinia coronata f. sp. avenae]|uniref:Ferric oxidoreductase domain-containing protein n=1 Tax=Puccinia coronata f. sp. avenae TaxID=200324 RepID=A0A2N5T4T2_9BASI|nr:hypothetical protein PCASD_15556 [Puccinia coronata f. sp. avenae]
MSTISQSSMMTNIERSSDPNSYVSLRVDEEECAEAPGSPGASLEVERQCYEDLLSSESDPVDSESNADHESHGDSDSQSGSSPTVINHDADHTAVNADVQYADFNGDLTQVQKMDPELSPVPYKHECEGNQPYIPPRINQGTIFFTWFTPYRQLFVLIFSINLIGAVVGLSGRWNWSKRNATPLVVGNILIAIAIRSEWVLRFLYWIAVKIFRPSIFPLCLRIKVVGILYHIGGVHSGCGLSALLWIIVAASVQFQEAKLHPTVSLVALGMCLACVALTCFSALPFIRRPFHNFFEMIHRFVGWAGIVSTIVYVILECMWNVGEQRWDLRASRLITKPQLWFLITILIITLFSWITTAKVPITVYASSEKASVIRVPGGLTSGLHTRISLGGLREWHIFGSISQGKHADCHYIVAAVQGEFTKMLNTEKPEMIYTKRWKPCGLPYFSRLFKRGLAMCTGSGIGAVASTCIQHDEWFLIWIGPNLEATYGKEIMQLIRDTIPENRRLIWDTRGPLGRPDVVRLLQNTHQYWEAEVTLFVGSPEMNNNVLQSCRALKTPVFGSIWDA